VLSRPAAWLWVGLLTTGWLSPLHAEIPVVELSGPIQAVSSRFVVEQIHRADAEGAPLLIVRLDTPGGFDTSMRQIIDAMLNCRTPIAAFVSPAGARAASAGFVIMVSADVAAMSPGTNAGAAHPVLATGAMDDVMSKKITEDAAAYLRGKAERRGRNATLAEEAIVKSRSFTDKEALDGRLIDLVAPDVTALVASLDGREIVRFDQSKVRLRLKGERIALLKMNLWQEVLSAIAGPETMFLLLLGAIAGIGTEISHPGAVLPGVVGLMCLLLFLFAGQVIPIHGAGVLLVLLGISFFVAEVKVASHGLLTAAGIASIILGAMMLVEAPVPEMRMRVLTLLPAALVAAALSLTVVRLAVQIRSHRPTTGIGGLVGASGRAETPLDPQGWVRVQGELWKARAPERVVPGESVVVTGVDGLELRIRKGSTDGA
jgi:membrane-bound serine protease (ClpP class)